MSWMWVNHTTQYLWEIPGTKKHVFLIRFWNLWGCHVDLDMRKCYIYIYSIVVRDCFSSYLSVSCFWGMHSACQECILPPKTKKPRTKIPPYCWIQSWFLVQSIPCMCAPRTNKKELIYGYFSYSHITLQYVWYI